VHINPVMRRCTGDERQKHSTVFVVLKNRHPVVPAVDDVHAHLGKKHSRLSRHHDGGSKSRSHQDHEKSLGKSRLRAHFLPKPP